MSQENGSHIRLERVGQYLKDCDLTQPIKATDKSLWTSIGKFPQLAGSWQRLYNDCVNVFELNHFLHFYCDKGDLKAFNLFAGS